MKQDLDISNVERKRKRVEQHKYDAVMADLRETSRYADGLFQKLEQAETERDRLKKDNVILTQSLEDYVNSYRTLSEMHEDIVEQNENAAEKLVDVNKKNATLLNRIKAIENGQLETKLRDQRDMARFIAALLLIVSVGFAVAVWIGKLVPIY